MDASRIMIGRHYWIAGELIWKCVGEMTHFETIPFVSANGSRTNFELGLIVRKATKHEIEKHFRAPEEILADQNRAMKESEG